MHPQSLVSLVSFSLLGGTFAAATASQGSVKIVNQCTPYVLYQARVGSGNTTLPGTLYPGETYSMAFSEAQPQEPTANHTLSFNVWPAYNSDKRRSMRRREASLTPRQLCLSQDLDFGFKFLIWDVNVTDSVAFGFENMATDPFPQWGWTWKLSSGDEACTTCTTLECAAKGCSVQDDVVMETCGTDSDQKTWRLAEQDQGFRPA